MKEALVRENENLNHLNKVNTSGDNLNESFGELKVDYPLYEGPSEPSVHNSKTDKMNLQETTIQILR